MALLADLDGKDILFTWGLFGVQFDELHDGKKQIITRLHQLLSQSAGRVDRLQDESHALKREQSTSTIFIAYWLSCQDYKAWKEDVFQPFWDGLPDDAGVWREVMTVPKSRYMFSTGSPVATGFASLVGMKPSTDAGYWGVYRHRMSETPDQYTAPGDTFTSPYTSKSTSKPKPGKKLVNLEKRYPDTVHSGRVKITKVPNNMCFVREVQGQPDLPKEELDAWLQSLNPYFRSWVDHLTTNHNMNGVVSFSTHLALESHATEDQQSIPDPADEPEREDVPIPEANQLMYFLDLADFELAGRAFKDHVKLRNTTMEFYGPGGKFSGSGKLHLMVEMCVLKSEDLDAEYIGCKEGTRLMILEDL
ncbi:hypothetical protein NW759_017463 [Fusarium solani]|nr:hypothetical protein NW759_017463 [Fusarium solani]